MPVARAVKECIGSAEGMVAEASRPREQMKRKKKITEQPKMTEQEQALLRRELYKAEYQLAWLDRVIGSPRYVSDRTSYTRFQDD